LFRVNSNSTRRAKAKWFLEHTWMKYSKTQDSVYCAPLRFFGPYVNCIRFQIKLNPLHIWQNNISKSTTYLYYIALLKCKLIFYFSKFMFKSWLVAYEKAKESKRCTVDTILSFWIFHPSVFKKLFSLCSPCRIRDYPEQNIS
jgi:hypothetical protein